MRTKLSLPFLSRLVRRQPPDFGAIPALSGGATLVYPPTWVTDPASSNALDGLRDAAHGMFQRSVTATPGAVFLVGLSEDEIKARYPMAQALAPVEKVGKVSMTPPSVMSLLRALMGSDVLKEYIWDLFYLEQAGNELSKPGPLAMIPDWVEDQLKVETMAAVICGMQRHDATVGAAVRALMKQDRFSFAMLDHLQQNAESGERKISPDVSQMLSAWSNHAARIVAELRRLLDDPPLALQYLPAIKEAQEQAPRVYYFPEEALPAIAPVLDTMVLSSGMRGAHHWYIDTDTLALHDSDGFNAVSRLGAALWQSRETRESGLGPAVWWDIGGEPPKTEGAKTFQHRCVQGSSFVFGYADQVVPAAVRSLGMNPPEGRLTNERVCALRVGDQAFRHLDEQQERAARYHSRVVTA